MSCDIIDDIEDILKQDKHLNGSEQADVDFDRSSNKSFIVPKKTLKKILAETNGGEHIAQKNGNAPGIASIYVKTWGCTHNSSDSEYMAGQLAAYGYNLVENPNDADLWLLNSCTVKNPAEDHFKNYIDKAKDMNKYLVLAGCVPQGAPKSAYIQGLSVIGVQQIDRIVEVVEETLKGNSVRLMGKKKKDNKKYGGASLSLPKVRRNPLIEIIAINTGCLNECTYCKTKHARGELGSYHIDEIVDRVKQSFQEGVVEIWLTSEDTGAYGRDIGTNIIELLWKIVEHIPDGCMLRIGMTNPPYILEHLEQMALVLQHPGVYSFLHIPIQSASDGVLADMKREYVSDDFRHIVNYLREKVPGVNVVTDIICGFPTESEKDFQETLDLVREFKFSSLFINQYFQRPGTPAAKMNQVPTQERKRRTRVISDLFNSYTTYDHKLGQKCKVLVTELSYDQEHYVGHNKFYEQILVPKIDSLMGKMVEVEIVECTKFSMKGKLLDENYLHQQPNVNTPLKKGEISGNSIKSKVEILNNDEGCCGNDGDEGTCCQQNSQPNESSCCSSSTKPKINVKNNAYFDNSDKSRIREYAFAGLIAFSAIIISKVALRYFYSNK